MHNIGVEDKIDQGGRNNIFELLSTPWSRDGLRLKGASENIRRDR